MCSSNAISLAKTHICVLIKHPHNHQLQVRVSAQPVGVIAQLVEHCTGMAEVWVRVPPEGGVSVESLAFVHFFVQECNF